MVKAAATGTRYHVVLLDGDERTIPAYGVRIEDAALTLVGRDGEVVTSFAPGQWTYVELERKDTDEN